MTKKEIEELEKEKAEALAKLKVDSNTVFDRIYKDQKES